MNHLLDDRFLDVAVGGEVKKNRPLFGSRRVGGLRRLTAIDLGGGGVGRSVETGCSEVLHSVGVAERVGTAVGVEIIRRAGGGGLHVSPDRSARVKRAQSFVNRVGDA